MNNGFHLFEIKVSFQLSSEDGSRMWISYMSVMLRQWTVSNTIDPIWTIIDL